MNCRLVSLYPSFNMRLILFVPTSLFHSARNRLSRMSFLVTIPTTACSPSTTTRWRRPIVRNSLKNCKKYTYYVI